MKAPFFARRIRRVAVCCEASFVALTRPKLLNYAGAVGDRLRLITRRTVRYCALSPRSSAFVLIAVAVDV